MNMQKSRRFSLVTGVLFVLAIGLLLFSTIGGARAALNIESDTFKSAIHTQNLSVALSTDDVVGEFLGGAGEWQPGVTYQGDKGNASVSAINDGGIAEYVRVTIYKYWIDPETGDKATGQSTDAKGNTVPTLSPDKILLGVDTSKWIVDSAKSSPECMVLYLKSPLGTGKSAVIFNSITIDKSVAAVVKQTTNDDGSITNEYVYDGAQFGIDILVDGVQTHHAHDAMLSAWGKNVSVTDDGPITAVN